VIELQTKRLRLRRWQSGDRAKFAQMNADPQVMRYFPNPLSSEESDRLAQKISDELDQRGWGLWAVEIMASTEFIGFVGLSVPSALLSFSPCVEIGWRINSPYWHQGYATEAAMSVLDAGFEQLNLKEIVSFTAEINTPSRRVMQRIGLRYGGETFEHPALNDGDPLKHHVLYRLNRAHWLLRETINQKT
jgi:RimJ/RimL family protein N-acetyltransferase